MNLSGYLNRLVLPTGLVAFSTLTFSHANLAIAADSALSPSQKPETAVEASNRIAAEITTIQQEIESAESVHGPLHLEVLEPLQRMITLQTGLENYEEVDLLIERYLQLTRINQNLSSFGQLSALADQISNDIELENWESINNRFQFMTWIFSQHSNFDTEDLLSVLDEFAAWNLAAIYIDHPELRDDHFMAYRAVIENAVEFAEREYGINNTRYVSWLYREALMEYRGETIQRTGDELRVGPAAGSFENALVAIEKIREIVDQFDSPEATGLALVYEADFIRIANSLERNKYFGSSERIYRDAIESFQEAGISEDKIAQFFSQPAILPYKKFHTSIDAAMEDQLPIEVANIFGKNEMLNSDEALEFTAWNESLQFTRRPERTSLFTALDTELYSVLLEVNLDKQGNARTIEGILSVPDSGKWQAYARDAVEKFTFRPNPTANRWRSESRKFLLLYQFTP